jgi:hypothetical protein
MTNDRSNPVEGEVLDAEPKHLIRHPGAPTNLNELASRKGEAVEIVEARVQVVETLRRASIRLTSPPDWLLFKAPDDQGGQIVGYVQDSGADRFRDLWGIEVFDVSDPEKITGNDAGVFTYIVRGSGRCRITGQTLEQIEGARSSTDDFCRGVAGVALEVLVRKAARANLDGGITRELAGMKSVPIEEIEDAWKGTPKKIADCRHGRGFGTRDERLGARSTKAPEVDPPVCPHCQSIGVFREGKNGRPGFYGCPKYKTHEDKRWIVDGPEWVAGAAARAAQGAPASGGTGGAPTSAASTGGAPAGSGGAKAATTAPAGRVTQDLNADDVFGPPQGTRRQQGNPPPRPREPGEEG